MAGCLVFVRERDNYVESCRQNRRIILNYETQAASTSNISNKCKQRKQQVQVAQHSTTLQAAQHNTKHTSSMETPIDNDKQL